MEPRDAESEGKMSDEFGWEILLFFGVVVVVAILSGIFGSDVGKRAVRTQAVEQGHAAWIPDAKGYTTFEWKALEVEVETKKARGK